MATPMRSSDDGNRVGTRRWEGTPLRAPEPAVRERAGGPHRMLAGEGSLSRVPPGHWVRVERVIFERPRTEARAEGVREGTILRCTAWLPDGVLVTFPDGGSARIPSDVADFVSVRLVNGGGGRPDGS